MQQYGNSLIRSSWSRRGFLGGTVGLLLSSGCWSPSAGQKRLAEERKRLRGRKLAVAVIGAGGQGEMEWRAICQSGDRLVALCDVDRRPLQRALQTIRYLDPSQAPRPYEDFREMFTSEPRLDAVLIATPDHVHAIQASWALERKIPVYLEPPICRSLGELRELSARAKSSGTAFWQGVDNRTGITFRRAVSCLESGMIGNLRHVYAWTSSPLWPQGGVRPLGCDPIPPELSWEYWIGPAPFRSYKAYVYHRANWRGWCDFGTGTLGARGPQLLNLLFQAYSLPCPEKIELLSPVSQSIESFPKSSHLRFIFPGSSFWGWKRSRDVVLDWYDGGLLPETSWRQVIRKSHPNRFPAEGLFLVGDQGVWLMADAAGRHHYFSTLKDQRLIPMEHHPLCSRIPLPRKSLSLQRIFLEMIRMGRIHAMQNNISREMMETLLTGCVAQQCGGVLQWRSWRGSFADAPRANQLVDRPARKGWELP